MGATGECHTAARTDAAKRTSACKRATEHSVVKNLIILINVSTSFLSVFLPGNGGVYIAL
jgi:hypothetical protein